MKTVVKTDSNHSLLNAKEKGWNWDDFHSNDQEAYQSCREQALKEQLEECAYTGLWLGEGTKQTIHIDHFKKKAIYPELTFEWNNLFAAAKDLDCGADFKDKKISGSRASSDKSYDNILSPLERYLSDYFWYRQDGAVIPHPSINDDELISKINNTIDIFNLNSSFLKDRRSGIIKMMRSYAGFGESAIREIMKSLGFSFVVDFELQRQK